MKPALQHQSTIYVIGIREEHVMSEEGGIPTILSQWGRFMARVHEIPNRDEATLGICLGMPQEGPFDYVTGAVLRNSTASIPLGMELVRLEPAEYAVFTHQGPIAALHETYLAIEQWLKENGGYRRAAAPEFELYDHRYISPDSPDSAFDIYVPVAQQEGLEA
ncbi:GyrI-like domain-containing protein [Paenibacillus silviterrae]|uniref:GyrI-like domain-containing protein n=1 Tax=Paenibacillus silviterrae TaxID=3242194 RepID=UPI002542FA22|nr:GyrI-like domain-containing protein [Paenibacillus chinjuensis]